VQRDSHGTPAAQAGKRELINQTDSRLPETSAADISSCPKAALRERPKVAAREPSRSRVRQPAGTAGLRPHIAENPWHRMPH